MGRWDGESDWSVESYPVPAGEHTFTWRYVKDYSVSTGSDCAWIDYIKLPAHELSYYINYPDKMGICICFRKLLCLKEWGTFYHNYYHKTNQC